MSDTVIKVAATFINFNTLTCNAVGDNSFTIAVSNNGVNTSQPLSFYIFNSNCVVCDAASDTCLFEVSRANLLDLLKQVVMILFLNGIELINI